MASNKSKDFTRNAIERVIKNMSERVKKGEDFTVDLPNVGIVIFRHKMAAVNFDSDLQETTRGVTAKNHFVNNLFSSNNNKHHM